RPISRACRPPRRPWLFLFSACGHPRDLRSFPTRRSSDLPRSPGGSVPPLERHTRAQRRPPSPGWASVPGVYGSDGFAVDWRPHRSEEHTSELQSRENLVCRLLLEKKKDKRSTRQTTRTST